MNDNSQTKRWFKKVNPSLPYLVGGKKVPFVGFGQNGILMIDLSEGAPRVMPNIANDELIEALDSAADNLVGGIVRITEEIAEDIKKNRLPSQLEKQLAKQQGSLKVWDNQPPRVQRAPNPNAAPVAADNPKPAGTDATPAVNVAGAGSSPASFTPAMMKKSSGPAGVLRPPASGQFRDGVLPPPVPPIE